MSAQDELPPDFFCPNPDGECPGRGADLSEVREPILDDDGKEIGVLIFMACSKCGYRWGDQS